MKRVLFSLILSISLLYVCHSQTGEINLDHTALGEGKIVRKAVFDGNSLWGYINGGADIYLEYGFKTLFLYEVEYRGSVIRFDLYRMSDPKAAYGIFSVYSFICDENTGPGLFNCITKWQIQSVKNEYYLSAILPTGSSDERTYATKISGELLASVEGKKFEPGFPFAAGKFQNIRAVIKYSRGLLGIDNGIAFDSSSLRESGFRELWQITGIENTENVTVTVLTFATADLCNEYAAKQRANNTVNMTVSGFSDGLSLLLIEGDVDKENSAKITDWFSSLKQ